MLQTRYPFLNVSIDTLSSHEILEKIKKYLIAPQKFIHIVSINPENCVIANYNSTFRTVCNESDLALIDGVGVLLGAKMLNVPVHGRTTGALLFERLLKVAGEMSLAVLLIGAQANLADSIAKCYSRGYPEARFIGINGYKDIMHPTKEEEEALLSIVRATRPRIVFSAFGSPAQELWFYSHKDMFKDIICMGVGGGFNYVAGASKQPNKYIRQFGLEWLYRLITEPGRWYRQCTRLPYFIYLVLAAKIRSILAKTNSTPHGKTPIYRP